MPTMDGAPISIHKALAGLDDGTNVTTQQVTLISIHKALAGLDMGGRAGGLPADYFNPQGPRGPRRHISLGPGRRLSISIHKALAGLDCTIPPSSFYPPQFQSTRPSRASTSSSISFLYSSTDFNPQGPRGPRPSYLPLAQEQRRFQSTRPSRASTADMAGAFLLL